jgi:hypothetical protein
LWILPLSIQLPSSSSQLTQYQLARKACCYLSWKRSRLVGERHLSRICFEMRRQVTKTRCQLCWQRSSWTPYQSQCNLRDLIHDLNHGRVKKNLPIMEWLYKNPIHDLLQISRTKYSDFLYLSIVIAKIGWLPRDAFDIL